jgi:hypothetical protein
VKLINYFNHFFRRSFGNDIEYKGTGDITFTSAPEGKIYFVQDDGKSKYVVTLGDIISTIRYVKFLAAYITFIFLILLFLLVFRS